MHGQFKPPARRIPSPATMRLLFGFSFSQQGAWGLDLSAEMGRKQDGYNTHSSYIRMYVVVCRLIMWNISLVSYY